MSTESHLGILLIGSDVCLSLRIIFVGEEFIWDTISGILTSGFVAILSSGV